MDTIQPKLRILMDELSARFMERRSMIEANMLGLLAKEHTFNLGVPGTGKSNVVTDLMSAFDGADCYETLLSRTRPEAAVLGPWNLPELREKGDFHRKITGFLPTATLAFLDEIGKMSPVLGHDLLAILNERKYHEVNGGRTYKIVPLYTAFTASNELIADESDDAAALWDRLMIRVEVEPIASDANFVKLLEFGALPTAPAPLTTIPWQDMADVIDNVVPAVGVPSDVIEAMVELRRQLRVAEIRPSDRRWRKAVRIIQAAAYLGGRDQAEQDDLYALRYVLWDDPAQITTVERMTLSISNPMAEEVIKVLDAVEEIARGIEDRRGTALEARAQYGADCTPKLRTAASTIAKLRQDAIAAGRSLTKIDEAGERVEAIKRMVYVECLDMDPSRVK